MDPLYLGVDGGQSSTTAMIGDASGRVVGFGRGGPCNHVGASEGRAKLVRAIQEAVSLASQPLGSTFEEVRFESACLGFSGGPEDKEQILSGILSCRRMLVVTDAVIALSGATGGGPGIMTIAGTGSICLGRDAEGRVARAGGWGYIFGDEGGGFDLTRQALRAALAMEEGWGAATSLRELFLKETGAESANALMHRFYTAEYPRPRIASYSKLLERAGADGDPIALEILENAGRQLARLVSAVRSQLFAPGEAVRVSPVGGVFRGPLLRQAYEGAVAEEKGNAIELPVHGPAAGALLEAYRLSGLQHRLSGVPEEEK